MRIHPREEIVRRATGRIRDAISEDGRDAVARFHGVAFAGWEFPDGSTETS